jgi:hypothetical protein
LHAADALSGPRQGPDKSPFLSDFDFVGYLRQIVGNGTYNGAKAMFLLTPLYYDNVLTEDTSD